MKSLLLTAALLPALHAAEPLFTREGTDPSFATLIATGTLKPGERFANIVVPGSIITVNHAALEKQTGTPGPIPKDIGIHTQNSSGISRKDFAKWSRWYQESGTTQVFRLFKDEQNIRSGTGDKGSPGRIEAYTHNLNAAHGAWREWEGTYTIITPIGANIFQLFHHGKDAKGNAILWPFHIRMNDKGDIYFARRRPIQGLPDRITLAENMTGKSLSIKVRSNGLQYEVFMKNPLEETWKPVTQGNYLQAQNHKISFRWGMYCGSIKGGSVRHDAMLFVNNVTIR